jgi:uncharacterized protein YecT (DUF1311 family)
MTSSSSLAGASAFAIGVLFAGPSMAAGHSAAFEECAAKTHGATFPLLHCYSEEMKAEDDALVTAYDAARAATSNPKTLDYLARSQTAWSDYRDAWCEATVPRSGSLARIRLFECRLALTSDRIAALKDLAR